MTSKPSTTPAAATTPSVGSRDKTVAWYHPTLGNLPPQTRDLLKTYSQIPESEMETHIYKIVNHPQAYISLLYNCDH
jgi:hypothetical protein